MIKTKKQMFIVIGVFTLVMMLGTVTFAFFNYTRTGLANTIRTGNINFESSQGTPINLTNMFPIDPTETGVMNDATKVGTVTINVTGNTSYDEGIEYLVSAVNVTNSVGSGANAKSLPISVNVSVASNTTNDPATTLGTSDTEYFTNRGGSNSIYKVLAGSSISDNDQLLVGYIAPDEDEGAVDGNIVIKAYIDKNNIAITDTYPEETIREVIETGYSSSACETALTGVTNASTYCASAASLQTAIDTENTLTSAQITALVNAGIVNEYTNGTTSNWVGERTVFTTSEWNALQQNGISFQIKVEANEGTWVLAPVVPTPTPEPNPTCPGPQCLYRYSTVEKSVGDNIGTLNVDYVTDNSSLGNVFLGHILNNDGVTIKENYVCYRYNGTVSCLRGGVDEREPSEKPVFINNMNILKASLPFCSALTGTLADGPDPGCPSQNENIDIDTVDWAGEIYIDDEINEYSCKIEDDSRSYCESY